MQGAFTKKTQALAEKDKEIEALKEKAEAFSKYEDKLPILEEMLSSQDQAKESPQMLALEQDLKNRGYSEDAIEMMKVGAGFVLNQFNQTQSKQQQEAWMESKINEASSLDPRLSDESLTYSTGDGETFTFGQLVADLTTSDPKFLQDPVGATKRAIKRLDASNSKAKVEGKEELSASAKAKAQKFPSTNSSPQTAVDGSQPATIQEAFKQAQAELGTN